MIKEPKVENTIIQYDLQIKDLKNINFRIKSDGSIYVSANKRVPQKVIDEFIKLKVNFIVSALGKYNSWVPKDKEQCFTESEVTERILMLCKEEA